RRGRVYLPLAWLREAGVDPDAWLAAPAFDARIASVVRRLLRAADALYARVDAGVALLPPACRPGIQAARVLYAEIGREVERRGCDSVSQRAVVSGPRKAALLARALAEGAVARGDARAELPPLDAVRWLVDAAVRGGPGRGDAEPRPAAAGRLVGAPLRFGRRAVWVVELCEQQAHRRLARRGASQPS
ncbi:MAG TPA: squalene/phytoene synthase family protein, partial [Burkholderiaceae bacterium]|nr:squalene/phytoene synthase family protein [Burkholderiaceae bacterium]